MNIKLRTLIACACTTLGMMPFVGCMDSDYKLDDIDLTIGIGDDEILLPVSSSAVIPLEDILKLNNSETIVEKENGDYYFVRNGGTVKPTETSVDPIRFGLSRGELYNFDIDLSSYSAMVGNITEPVELEYDFEKEKNIYCFTYLGTIPDEIDDLESAQTDVYIYIQSQFSASMRTMLPIISELTIELPRYLNIGTVNTDYEYAKEGTNVVLKNVDTSKPLKLGFDIESVDFNEENSELGTLVIENNKITMTSYVKMKIKANKIVIDPAVNPKNCKVQSSFYIDELVEITEVRGTLNPAIDIYDLGKAEFDDIPDFLTNDGVVVDIHNPQLILFIDSELDMPGYVGGTLRAFKDGVQTAEVEVPDFRIEEKKTSKVCICRRNENLVDDDYTFIVEVPNLSSILDPVPDSVCFDGHASADRNTVVEFTLGKTYTLHPRYHIETPLAFGENARIVYCDTLKGLNEDLKDVDVTKNTRIELTADIENRIPAYLNVSAVAIDVNGNEMPTSEVAVQTIGEVSASADGSTPVTSPLKVELTIAPGASKKIEGLKVTASGSARSDGQGQVVTGQILNSRNHSLVVKNLQIKLVGKFVVDLND